MIVAGMNTKIANRSQRIYFMLVNNPAVASNLRREVRVLAVNCLPEQAPYPEFQGVVVESSLMF